VIATGEQHSVREFVNIAAQQLVVAVDPRYFRPSKAKQQLGWTPKISFMELVKEMVAADMQDAERDDLIKKEGFKTFNYHE
jgi:GDPmannose 4,6-dehydratase